MRVTIRNTSQAFTKSEACRTCKGKGFIQMKSGRKPCLRCSGRGAGHATKAG